MENTNTHTRAAKIWNVQIEVEIETSSNIPQLEEARRSCARGRRSALRVAKWGRPEDRADAMARIEAFDAKAAAIAARLESFND